VQDRAAEDQLRRARDLTSETTSSYAPSGNATW
jgi:hypothetical protein